MKKTIPLLLFVFLIPLPVYADDDAEDAVKDLGWVALGAGIIANIPFIIFNKVRRYAASAGGSTIQIARQMASSYKPLLNFHIILNSIGYFSGMTHGLLLSSHLEPISLSLALVMTVLMASGILLRYTSSRNTKVFNRLLHGQFGLVILLAALVFLHVASADD